MPSSAVKSRSRPRQTSTANSWFSASAIERIAACVSSDLPIGEQKASTIIARYLGRDRTGEPSGLECDDFVDSTAPSQLERLRFYSFAGLIEIATVTGYVDLDGWQELASFESALKEFEALEASPKYASTDLTLIRELLSRLKVGRHRVPALENNAFYAFASYLHLTSAVHVDTRFHEFIREASSYGKEWIKVDLSFLLSPRHFSEALGNGTVAGISAPGVKNGLIALNYFCWLTEILDRIRHNSEIADKLIRHARWAHHVSQVRERLDFWAGRMGEWDELPSEPEHVSDGLERGWPALRPSQSELDRLGVELNRQNVIIGEPSPNLRPEGEVVKEADELVSEGRMGAAKRALRLEVARIDTVLREYHFGVLEPEEPVGLEPVVQGQPELEEEQIPSEKLTARMLVLCAKLAELGDIDAAAVFLVRHDFVEIFGANNQKTIQARELIARAREAGHQRTAVLGEPVQSINSDVNVRTAQSVKTHGASSADQ